MTEGFGAMDVKNQLDKDWLNCLVNKQCMIIYSKDVWSSGDIAKQIVEARKYIEGYLNERDREKHNQAD